MTLTLFVAMLLGIGFGEPAEGQKPPSTQAPQITATSPQQEERDQPVRRVALQEVRFAVEEATLGRDFEHRLRDFNNLPETRLEDIKRAWLGKRQAS